MTGPWACQDCGREFEPEDFDDHECEADQEAATCQECRQGPCSIALMPEETCPCGCGCDGGPDPYGIDTAWHQGHLAATARATDPLNKAAGDQGLSLRQANPGGQS